MKYNCNACIGQIDDIVSFNHLESIKQLFVTIKLYWYHKANHDAPHVQQGK